LMAGNGTDVPRYPPPRPARAGKRTEVGESSHHTPGPWAWGYIGEKSNGYIVGLACKQDGTMLSGYVDADDIVETLIYKGVIGEHEAATCNYADARLIA